MYENGTQAIGWHADREEIGRTTPIASISLGATRTFMLKSKNGSKNDKAEFHLEDGSLTIMENVCQHEYLHSVPKETTVTKGRINLTFRCKGEQTEGERLHQRRDNLNFLATPPPGAGERFEFFFFFFFLRLTLFFSSIHQSDIA